MKATANKKSALRRRKKKLSLIAVIGIILSLVIVVGGASAYLKKETSKVTNTFTAAKAPTPEVEEEFNDEVKKNVKVTLSNEIGESGTYYVRAAVVFSLQDDDKNTIAKVPVSGTDYTVTYNTTDWTQNGDYWYCREPIAPGGSTPVLITECTSSNSDYHLVVDVLAQTVQADPTTVATDVWGHTPAPGEN